jgi:hypothetical protein
MMIEVAIRCCANRGMVSVRNSVRLAGTAQNEGPV